ncbi:MAG: hypothetical protein C5B56_07075 [Proteobacteria bacterium]|nr:MAG: hypothetical protein C5B56_07075 [Pseudomonadota bacterium]
MNATLALPAANAERKLEQPWSTATAGARLPIKASDAMTSKVISIRPDVTATEIAKVLLGNGISAVPVVDENGSPIGMVSEGDLIPRRDLEREARRDWWLALLAEGQPLSPEFLAGLAPSNRVAEQIMSSPVVTVAPDTDVTEIAQLLATHRIKRVPVVQGGRIVGIVSRADLLLALTRDAPARPSKPSKPSLASALATLDEHLRLLQPPKPTTSVPAAENGKRAPQAGDSAQAQLVLGDFQHAVVEFEHKQLQQQEEARRAALEER